MEKDEAAENNMPGMAKVVERNIKASLKRRKLENEANTTEEKVADVITRFAGSIHPEKVMDTMDKHKEDSQKGQE
ncbi:hypothetical protein [Mucilaginibacter sp. PAMB04168]|uniref:hypothetical protein n=1 Tax=Mucilaginibacter sp. PAMB04168 TaxID=3138567 RepID=UPI0031F63855